MGSNVSRRTVLAGASASMLGACSLARYSVTFNVDERALDDVLDAVRSFASAHNYRSRKPSRAHALASEEAAQLSLKYRRATSEFRFDEIGGGEFIAELRYTQIDSPDNLQAWLEEFKATIRPIDGVRLAEGYE
jgi:hypothetical protein